MISVGSSVRAVAAVVLLSAPLAAGVHVVSPSGPFTQISSAVAAAVDGDVILVKAGTYGPVGINGKSVAIVAEVGATVTVAGPINGFNLPAGKTVVLDRIDADGHGASPTHALLIINCAGAVRVQQGDFLGGDGTASIDDDDCNITGVVDGSNAVRVHDSPNVAFAGCTLTGGGGAQIWSAECHIQRDTWMVGGAGGAALEIEDASVTVYSSSLFGGGSGSGGYSSSAGSGAVISAGSSLVFVGSVALGGNGGDSFDGIFPAAGGSGGFGIAANEGSDLRLLDDQLQGGMEGSGWGIPGGALSPALGSEGTVTTWSGDAPVLGFSKLVREGQITPIQVTGTPGDAVLVYISLQTAAIASMQAQGTFLLSPTPLIGPIVLGTLGGGGLISLNATIPNLPASLQSIEVYMQALLVGGSGPTLSSWGHLTILDSSF